MSEVHESHSVEQLHAGQHRPKRLKTKPHDPKGTAKKKRSALSHANGKTIIRWLSWELQADLNSDQ